jgi:hypothetical protein
MRAPVVTPLPAELLALEVVHRGDEDRARLVEQPVRLRLARTEGRWRVEAIEHTVPVVKLLAVLGSSSRGEEEQLQLIGRQDTVPVQVERDLPVALGQMPRQLEQALRAHAERPRPGTRTRPCPFLSGFANVAHHAALRACARSSGSGATPSEAPPITPAKPPPERIPSRLSAASSKSSASNATASRSTSGASGKRRGGNSLNFAFVLLNHLRAGGGASQCP